MTDSYISERSHLEVANLVRDNAVVLLPVGSQEQHGYLPTGIDNLLAQGYTNILDVRLTQIGIKVAIFPPLNFGYTPICQGYSGTISFSKDTFESVLTEILFEIIHSGFKTIIIVNGHRDNHSSIDKVIKEVAIQHTRIKILNPIYTWLRTTEEFKRKYPEQSVPKTSTVMDEFVKKVGLLRHADAAEMSLLYAIYPELQKVYEDKLAGLPMLPDLHNKLPATHDEWKIVTSACKGGAGDPRGVDVAFAKKVIDSLVNELLKTLEEEKQLNT